MTRTLIALALMAFAFGAAHAERNYSASSPASKAHVPREFLSAGLPEAPSIVLGALPAEGVAAARKAVARTGSLARPVGIVRDLPFARNPQWHPVANGVAAHWRVRVEGAVALRVRLDVRSVPAGFRARFASAAHPGSVVAESLDRPGTLWSPVIDGDEAVVELFAPTRAAAFQVDVRITQVADHFEEVSAKSASSSSWLASPCQADLICESKNDPVLARAGTASIRINWVYERVSYACSATLLNPSDGSFRPYIYTAAHCLVEPEAASTLVSHWFYDKSTCGGEEVRADAIQVGGGAQLLAADEALDASFLLLNRMPPPGVTFAGWDSEPPAEGAQVTALHHANGEVTKVSHATVIAPPPYERVAVAWNKGIVQGGSSGSGFFTRVAAPVPDLLFRGGLSSGNSSCEAPGFSLYSRIDKFWPKIAPYLSVAASSANATGLWWDPSQPGWGLSLAHQGDTVFGVLFLHGEDGRATWLVAPAMQGEGDGAFSGLAYRVTGTPFDAPLKIAPAAQAVGTMRVALANANAAQLVVALDGQPAITRHVSRQVYGAHAPVCSASAQKSRAAATNYQDLWWNPDEPGWGLAIAHQDDILFATLFTYDEKGAPTWLVASNVARRSDGVFAGAIYRTARTAGPPASWQATTAASAGGIELDFADGETGTATFTIAGARVTRRIVRQVFGKAPPTCH